MKMKEKLQKLFGWVKISNRPKHLVAGTLIFITMMIQGVVLDIRIGDVAVMAFSTVLIAALSVEYKDMLWGGKFDWLDVLATVLVPGVIALVASLF